ncbi:hypothetical protein ACIF9R_28685 [Streptomyces sp. NPDC086080]|uniref:hypothetical protein n=1 Tax=Streptomyces sp. NPDC086080 TaxID=3365748 RepID=UPI0037D899F6
MAPVAGALLVAGYTDGTGEGAGAATSPRPVRAGEEHGRCPMSRSVLPGHSGGGRAVHPPEGRAPRTRAEAVAFVRELDVPCDYFGVEFRRQRPHWVVLHAPLTGKTGRIGAVLDRAGGTVVQDQGILLLRQWQRVLGGDALPHVVAEETDDGPAATRSPAGRGRDGLRLPRSAGLRGPDRRSLDAAVRTAPSSPARTTSAAGRDGARARRAGAAGTGHAPAPAAVRRGR